MDRTLADRDRTNRLMDAYGALLTARQQRMLRQYYQDDLSLGEIAGQMRVSRQAVHDGLRRALAALERYEAALRLVDRPDRPPRPAARPPGARGGEHYFVPAPRSRLRSRVLRVTLRGRPWTFQTASGVFSHRALDAGTRLLAERMRVGRAERVLDMGCGYGVIGLVAAALAPQAEVWMTDTNQRAAALARANAARHHLANVRVVVADAAGPIRGCSMDLVLTNPPIRAGRRVVRTFIEEAWRVLRPGGRFYLVARTAQGARTLARLIEERFGGIRQVAVSGGYRVYEATRSQPAGRSSTEAAGV